MKKKYMYSAMFMSVAMFFMIGFGHVLAAPEVIDFELEIELKDHEKYDIEYEKKGDRFEAEYRVPGSAKIYGDEAKVLIDPLLEQLKLTPDQNKQELEEQIISIFNIDKSNIDDFELEVKFSDGQKLKIN